MRARRMIVLPLLVLIGAGLVWGYTSWRNRIPAETWERTVVDLVRSVADGTAERGAMPTVDPLLDMPILTLIAGEMAELEGRPDAFEVVVEPAGPAHRTGMRTEPTHVGVVRIDGRERFRLFMGAPDGEVRITGFTVAPPLLVEPTRPPPTPVPDAPDDATPAPPTTAPSSS